MLATTLPVARSVRGQDALEPGLTLGQKRCPVILGCNPGFGLRELCRQCAVDGLELRVRVVATFGAHNGGAADLSAFVRARFQ